MKFDHIGVVMMDLSAGRYHMAALLGITEWTREFDDPANRVRVQFGRDASGVCYETIAPLGENSPIADALRRSVRVLNHVAYLVEDLDAAGARMTAQGCVAVAPSNPAVAYDGHRIQFFGTPLRFIVELIEAPNHHHSYTLGESPAA